MKTRKNFWASAMIAMVWLFVMFLQATMSYRNDAPLVLMGAVAVAFFITYRILHILQYIPDVLQKQEPPRRSQQRLDDLLSSLDDTQLDLLRARLADREEEDFDSLGDLLAEKQDKRKNR